MEDNTQVSAVPLSEQAQEAKERMQQQLLAQFAGKVVNELEEEERKRRIAEHGKPDAARQATYDRLIVVQEDLLRCLNLLKVKFLHTRHLVQITMYMCHKCHSILALHVLTTESKNDFLHEY